MSRRAVKEALKNNLQSVPGVKTVFTQIPRRQDGVVFPSIVIDIGSHTEKVVTMGNPATRRIHYKVSLYIQNIDPNPNEKASQDAFDDLLDAIDTAIRSDKTLGGQAVWSAWTEIDTTVFDPQIAGQGGALILRAIKTFEVAVDIIG